MPTSSQAMILRNSYDTERPPFNVRCSPITFLPGLRMKNRKYETDDEFRLTAALKHPVKELNGVFAYDPVTQDYRWKIFPKAKPNAALEQSTKVCGDFADGDIEVIDASEESRQTTYLPEVCDSKSTLHFPSPCGSRTSNVVTEETYERLEDLGFRRRSAYSARIKGAVKARGKFGDKPLGRACSGSTVRRMPTPALNRRPRLKVIPITADIDNRKTGPMEFFKRRSPTTCKTPDDRKRHTMSLIECRHRRIHHPKPKSLLDEVKESVNWQGRVVHIALPRPVSARIHVNTVVFSLRDARALAHMEVKRLVEKQIGYEVTELQFDPVSMRTSDPNVLDRWIVTFGSKEHCYLAIAHGLEVEGDTLSVRPWEDIAHEEMFGDTDRSHTTYRYQSNKALRKLLNLA